MEWILIRLNGLNIEYLIYFDWVAILFIRVVLLISSIILFYRIIYINNEKFLIRYYYLLIIFVFSIILIILRPNIIRIILGWDGLGLVSFCLVIFYQNYNSYNSGILTVVLNRLGDIIILIVIGIIIIYGRWNFFILKDNKIFILLLIIARITKRAQIPFSSWLPEAIAAPTPISALVHSSTLVTAGIYLIIRFNNYIINRGLNKILIVIRVLTIFISGLIANFENDLKKIIALSTLRQLGIIIIILRIGFSILAYYHLLIHAIFKSLLFIRVGVIIHLINNNQDIRYIGNLNIKIPFSIIRFQLTLIALIGFPFFSGFYSKDLIIEIIYLNKFNIIILILSIISLRFTVMYSLRLIYYLFFKERKISFLNFKEDYKINISIIILIILRVIIGSIINWIFFINYVRFIKIRKKILTFILILFGILIFLIILYIYILKIYNLLYFIRNIWFLNYYFKYILKLIMEIRIYIYIIDKNWIEFYSKKFFLNNIFYSKFFKIKIKIFIFIYWIILIIVIINIYLNSLNKALYWRYKINIFNIFK